MIENLSSEFSAEIKIKQDALDVTQARLRAATRELAEQRRQTQTWQSSLSQLDQVRQRIRNIERVLKDEDNFDWTGKGGAKVKALSLTEEETTPEDEAKVDPDPPFPEAEEGTSAEQQVDTVATLVRLKRMSKWHSKVGDLMQQRISRSKGASAEKELQCRRVVSLCTGVPTEQVDAVSTLVWWRQLSPNSHSSPDVGESCHRDGERWPGRGSWPCSRFHAKGMHEARSDRNS